MVYFNISNSLGYVLAKKHAEVFISCGFPVTFLRYRNERNILVEDNEQWKTIWLDGFPYINLYKPLSSAYKNITNIIQLSKISFHKNDILFVLEEYELNSLLLAKRAKKEKAIVILLDETLGVFIPLLIDKLFPESISMWRMQKFIYPLIYKNIRLLNGPFSMDDKCYDYFLPTYKIQVKRNIKTIYIRHPLLDLNKEYSLVSSRIILMTSASDDPKYEAPYWNNLEKLAPLLVKKFEKVYLKLHPREHTAPYRHERQRSIALACKYGLELIDKNITSESVIPECKAKYVVSFYSMALFNSIVFGCHPIFLYQFLLPPNKKNKIFSVFDQMLKGLNYNFIKSLDDINPDYDCGIKKEDLFELNYSIKDFVREYLIKQ